MPVYGLHERFQGFLPCRIEGSLAAVTVLNVAPKLFPVLIYIPKKRSTLVALERLDAP